MKKFWFNLVLGLGGIIGGTNCLIAYSYSDDGFFGNISLLFLLMLIVGMILSIHEICNTDKQE